ncbi:MAG TPA: TraB/GumN family protein [Gammaproteobacteria bacterium]|nr:TraB/GumN family protein [Gammaproteobacteria bacterium]
MQPHLKAGNAFIAVGALHLPGETGLLSLLEQRGYTVRAIY